MPWPRPRSGCTRPNACATALPSAPGPCASSPTWKTPPPPGSTGTTPAGSCNASVAARQPKPRPSITLHIIVTASRLFTHNEACLKLGTLHDMTDLLQGLEDPADRDARLGGRA